MGVVLHVVEHGMDALAVLLQTSLVDVGRQLDMLWVFAALHIADGWHLTAWDVLDDALVGQGLQHLMEVGRTQATLLTDECLVDISEVGKESTIVAQERDDEAFFAV